LNYFLVESAYNNTLEIDVFMKLHYMCAYVILFEMVSGNFEL